MSTGHLFVCATPIGNLADMSERLRETLRSVDIVYAEDTRRTARLLQHSDANVPMRSLFTGNEKARTDELIEDVVSGKQVALVSDAGMPTVSDPGHHAISEAREKGLDVTVVPGPSSVTTAVAASGFSADRFVFDGFLPRKGKERNTRISALVSEVRPAVIFASPHRLSEDLADLRLTLGDEREITVCRELTKLHEEVWTGTLGEAVSRWVGDTKGEVTLVVGPALPQQESIEDVLEEALILMESGSSVSDAARKVAETSGLRRRDIYQALLERQERN